MSKQPKPTDYIELWVEDDGDVILCKRQEPQSGNGPADPISYPTGNLCYGIGEMEELAAELNGYGCTKEAIKKAILGVSFENYNEEVTV